jgi:hypothetical protein
MNDVIGGEITSLRKSLLSEALLERLRPGQRLVFPILMCYQVTIPHRLEHV